MYLRRFVWGAVFGAVLAVLPVELGLDGSLKSWLYVLGGTEECVGVALVASPELFPRASQAWGWLSRRSRALATRSRVLLQRLLRRPQHVVVQAATAEATASASLGTEVIRGFPPDDAPVEEQVAHLRKVVQEQESRIASVEALTGRVETELRAEIHKTRTELEALSREQVRDAAETHLEWRYAGLTVLFIGLGLATAGNLV
jgi:hypothetical protein